MMKGKTIKGLAALTVAPGVNESDETESALQAEFHRYERAILAFEQEVWNHRERLRQEHRERMKEILDGGGQ
jgi:hypothetical protein